MKKQNGISVAQLYCMGSVGRIIMIFTLNSAVLGGTNWCDNVVSALLAAAMNFVLVIPVFLLHRFFPDLDILDAAKQAFGKWMTVIAGIYILYFVLITCYYLAYFEIFVGNVIDPKLSVWILSGCVLAAACYGAFRGIEAIGRTSVFVVLALAIGLCVIFFSLLPKVRADNYRPLFYNGTGQLVNGVLLFLSRSTVISTMAFLLPRTKGRKFLGFTAINLSVYFLVSVFILIMVGAMGAYADTQLFPVYTAASLSEIGTLQRLDALFLAVWVAGLFIKSSTDLRLVYECAEKIGNKKAGNIAVFSAAGVTVVLSSLITSSAQLQKLVFGWYLILPATVLASVLIPFLVFLTLLGKRRKTR